MRILDQNDQEVTDPDLTLGHLEPEKVFLQHHEEIPEQLPVTRVDTDNPYYVGPNGGKLVPTIIISEYQPRVPAYDEYEDILRYILYTEEELAEIEAQKKAEEEAQKEAEEQAKREEEARIFAERTQNAIQTLSLMVMPEMSFAETSDPKTTELYPLYPEWEVNHEYKKGDPFKRTVDEEVRYFRTSQDIVSTDIYKPGDPGTESLYYEIELASDGIMVWRQPSGDHDAPRKGDQVHYPTADDPVYESILDVPNSWSPDAYPQGWTEINE